MKILHNLLLMSISLVVSKAVTAQEASSTFTHKVGSFEVILLSEGQQNGKSSILIGATPEMLKECLPNGTFPNATNAFLAKTPDKNILVDAGLGKQLTDNLHKLGVAAVQVDIVLITHMHGDHIGGLLTGEKVVFANAEIYIPQMEYDYWMSDEEMNRLPEERRGGFKNVRKVVEAYKERIHLFQPSEVGVKSNALFDGFYGFSAYGHTPGHTVYLLESNGEKLMIWGDLTHAMAIQMPYPQVAVTYDVNPEDAIASRARVLAYVSQNKIPIAGMHIAFPGMGIVSNTTNGGYSFTPISK